MQPRTDDKLVRKQYLVSAAQAKKLERIARERGTSAADVLRQAIEAYDPLDPDDLPAGELKELVSLRLKEAIAATELCNRRAREALTQLGIADIENGDKA